MNPFSLVYQKIYDIAAENTILSERIRPGNQIRFDAANAGKKVSSSADFPELILVQSALLGNLIASSARSEVTVTYEWILTTGSWDLGNLGSELQWGLFTASSRWCQDLTVLQWNYKNFVKNVQLSEVSITVDDDERNRGIQGWTIVWPLLVEMYFLRTEIRNYQWEPTKGNTA